MGIVFITHDLGVVGELADYVYVMYAGRIVEHGPVAEVVSNPLHPYTQGLLRCTPRIGKREDRLQVIPGGVPDPTRLPRGCRFHPRCWLSAERAREKGRATIAVEPECSRTGGVPTSATAAQSMVGRTADACHAGDTSYPAALRRCVETYGRVPSGQPKLEEVRPAHFVACWEVDRVPVGAAAGTKAPA